MLVPKAWERPSQFTAQRPKVKKLKIFVSLIIFLVIVFLTVIFFKNPPLKKANQFNLSNDENRQLTKILTLDSIFSADHSWTSTLSTKNKVTLVTTGDVILGRTVNYLSSSRRNFNMLFEKTANTLKSADITLVNFESPLVKNCQPTVEGMVFCGNERNIEGLVFAGIDVANLANNHLSDQGEKGIQNTINILKSKNIKTCGSTNPVFVEVKGIRFAFLGYNSIDSPKKLIAWADEKVIAEEVRSSRQNSDIVVVSFHFGDEYTSQPNKKQRSLAHLAIDSGADLIIGNHPHWIQPTEIYKGKLIVYAHGNFIFDQMWSEKTKEGVVGRYTFYNKKLIDVEFLPVYIENYGQPHFLTGEKKRDILAEMKKESLKL